MTHPRYAEDPVMLADLSAHLLAERVTKYPAIVAAGRLTQAQADDGIRKMRAVARRFAMIKLRDLDQPWERATTIATPAEMREVLAAVAARTAEIAAADPSDLQKADMRGATAAMLWHAERAMAASDGRG